MESQPEFSSIIETWTINLKETLKGPSIDLKVLSLLKMLDECQRLCPVDFLDELIFSVALPSACQLLSKIIDELRENSASITLENKIQTSEKLDYCNCLLGCWQRCFEVVKNHSKVSISQVKILLGTFLEATKCIWEHCKNSEKIYGELVNEHAGELKSLFMQTKNLLQAFVSLMNNVIVCDTTSIGETEILISVIDELGNLAMIVSDIDDYVLSITWKIFAKLVIKYECNIKSELAQTVICRFSVISGNITQLLGKLVKDYQLQKKEKDVLYISVLLAVLEKLFDIFSDFVDDKVIFSFIELLVQLNSHSPIRLKSLKIEPSVIKAMELNTSTNLESFLLKNLKNDHFFKMFHKYEIKDEKDTFGYHLMVLSILKNLAEFPYDSQRLWILQKCSILDRAMSNSDSLYTEFCIPQFVGIPNVHDLGENPRLLSLYEATLTRICNVLCKVSAKDFEKVENFLLQHLLSGRIWSSQLSSDIWCLISRLGSVQLRYDHAKSLLKLYSHFLERKTCFEKIAVSNLVTRIYLNLSDEQKNSILIDLEDLPLDVWQPVKSDIPERARARLVSKISGHEFNFEAAFNDLWENPSTNSWKKFTKILKYHGIAQTMLDKKMAEIVKNCFKNTAKVADNCDGAWPFFLIEFVEVLLDVIRYDENNSYFIEPILQSMITISQNSPPYLRIATLNFLINNAQMLTDTKSSSVANAVAKLFLCFLEDNDPCVLKEALEIFSRFAHYCPNDEFGFFAQIMSVVKKDAKITKIVRSYAMQDSPPSASEISSLEEFVRLTTKDIRDFEMEHVCCEMDDGQKEEKIPKLDFVERGSSMENLEVGEKVEFVLRSLEELVQFKSAIPEESLEKLQIAVVKLYP